MPFYKRRTEKVKAVQYNDEEGIPLSIRLESIQSGRKRQVLVKTSKGMIIDTLEGKMRVNDTDWIVRGTHGEFYCVTDEIFKANYEEDERDE